MRGFLLNQFSLSEHEGYLRAASTEEPDWWSAPDGGGARERERRHGARRARGAARADRRGRRPRPRRAHLRGAVPRPAGLRRDLPPDRPALRARPLRPRAARRARRAEDPRVLLATCHPVDDATLIGIGQAADAEGRTLGTQVSLFDVSDLTSPRRIAQRELDSDWSEAESDHHAVLYWPATRPARAAGPVVPGGAPSPAPWACTSRARRGSPRSPASAPRVGARAALLVVGDALYTVSDEGILASALGTFAPRGYAAFD